MSEQSALEELMGLFDLETIDADLYRGRPVRTTRTRVFGGQVAAQALCAGIRTVDPAYTVHSMHSYFLLPGDPQVPIVYDVERIRDGRSFLTRRVAARQHGRPIYYLTANFQVPEDGLEHQDTMPEVVAPEDAIDMVEMMRRGGTPEADALAKEWAALGARWIGDSRRGLPEDPVHPSRSRLWLRVEGDLGDDPTAHLAAFTYASDISLLGATLAAHPVGLGADPDGLARPHDLVPPALPRRRVVALRPGLAGGARWAGAGHRPGLHPGRLTGRHGRAGGPDPTPATSITTLSFVTDTPTPGYFCDQCGG